ncbi:MAG TPA: CsgG/HfaB family protein [Candidatus Limnocylindria bacterium]|nr:CsgG/HfaB family protein [Candidatus Limnocylindria bacterium]
MKLAKKFVEIVTLAAGVALVAGCSTAGVKNPSATGVTELRGDEKGFVGGTGVESQDVLRVSDKIARGILSAPQIANATTPPVIVLDPVLNETRFPINKNIFLDRIQAQLISKAAGKVTFLARERLAALEKEREMKRTGAVTATSDARVQEFKGADYFLTGKLSGMSTSSRGGVSDYILYTFQLIDARTSAIVWGGDDEIKKQAQSDAVYR